MIIPEVAIQDIVYGCSEDYADQEVDFYIPNLGIVIEIDGFQHEGISAIYDLSEQNARNIIEALISPFIEEFDPEYELEIN